MPELEAPAPRLLASTGARTCHRRTQVLANGRYPARPRQEPPAVDRSPHTSQMFDLCGGPKMGAPRPDLDGSRCLRRTRSRCRGSRIARADRLCALKHGVLTEYRHQWLRLSSASEPLAHFGGVAGRSPHRPPPETAQGAPKRSQRRPRAAFERPPTRCGPANGGARNVGELGRQLGVRHMFRNPRAILLGRSVHDMSPAQDIANIGD